MAPPSYEVDPALLRSRSSTSRERLPDRGPQREAPRPVRRRPQRCRRRGRRRRHRDAGNELRLGRVGTHPTAWMSGPRPDLGPIPTPPCCAEFEQLDHFRQPHRGVGRSCRAAPVVRADHRPGQIACPVVRRGSGSTAPSMSAAISPELSGRRFRLEHSGRTGRDMWHGSLCPIRCVCTQSPRIRSNLDEESIVRWRSYCS